MYEHSTGQAVVAGIETMEVCKALCLVTLLVTLFSKGRRRDSRYSTAFLLLTGEWSQGVGQIIEFSWWSALLTIYRIQA